MRLNKAVVMAALVLSTSLWCERDAAAAGQPEPLLPEVAFQVAAKRVSKDVVRVTLTAAPGYAIYRDRVSVSAETAGAKVLSFAPEAKQVGADPKQYRGTTDLVVKVQQEREEALVLRASLQGCGDVGVCYMPMHVRVPVEAVN